MKHVFFLSYPVNCPAWEGSQPSATCENFHLMFSQEHQSYNVIYSDIQILFSEFLKAAENVKKKFIALSYWWSSIIIIDNPGSISDLPQTLWRFVQQGIFIYTIPTSSAVDNSAFQWHSGGKSSVKTRAAPLQLSHHHKTVDTLSRSVLQSVTNTDVMNPKFPQCHAQNLTIYIHFVSILSLDNCLPFQRVFHTARG